MEIREIADALSSPSNSQPLRLRKGVVFSGGGTTAAQVYIGGSTVAVAVGFPKNAPANGANCWVLQQGPLLIGLF